MGATPTIYPREGPMFNPPHPGEILKELYIEPLNLSVTKIADKLRVDRKTVSRIINGRSIVTAEMALRLSKLFNTSPNLWLNMQASYDLWQAKCLYEAELEVITPMSYSPMSPA